ncbi:MAG: DUF1850 domain-containing protein [Thermovirgaceae bacterium]
MLRTFRMYFLLLFVFSGFVVVLCSPVSVVALSEERGTWLRLPVPLGQRLVATYIHSVQKTPVEDEYVVSDGWIWQWQERAKSHNAGLPVDSPRNGSFRTCSDWFIYRGGRMRWKTLLLRVGTERLGQNRIEFAPPWEEVSCELFRVLPERVLFLQLYDLPLVEGLIRRSIPVW